MLSCLAHNGFTCSPLGVQPAVSHCPSLSQPQLHSGLLVPEGLLSKRLRFEARILTQYVCMYTCSMPVCSIDNKDGYFLVCVCVCMYVCTYAGKAVMYIASCVVFSFWLITQLPSTSTDSLGRSKPILVCGCVTQVEQCSYCLLCRSSALPVIQRGCYTHLIGHRKGQPLEINYIKKGSVIHFRSSDHPGLPSSLRIRPMVALMITNVDEKAKKQLL